MDERQLDELEEMHRCAIPGPWDGVISFGAVRYLGPTTDSISHGQQIAGCMTTGMAILVADMHAALPELIRIARESLKGSK